MMIHAARVVTHIVLLVHRGTSMYITITSTAGRWMSDRIERWM